MKLHTARGCCKEDGELLLARDGLKAAPEKQTFDKKDEYEKT